MPNAYRFTPEELNSVLREQVIKGYRTGLFKFKGRNLEEDELNQKIHQAENRWGHTSIVDDPYFKLNFLVDDEPCFWSFDYQTYLSLCITAFEIGVNISREVDFSSRKFQKEVKDIINSLNLSGSKESENPRKAGEQNE